MAGFTQGIYDGPDAGPLTAPSPDSNSFDDAIKRGKEVGTKLQSADEAAQQKIDTAGAEAKEKIGSLENLADGLHPPAMQPIPPPTPKMTSPQEMWGSAAMIFAGLGALLTRQPALTALNAGAAAIKGYQQKDQAAADQAMETWKIATKNALDMHNYQSEVYKDIMDRISHKEDLAVKENSMDTAAAKTDLVVTAKALNDPMMAQIVTTRGLAAGIDLQAKRDAAAKKMEESGLTVLEQNQFNKAYQEYLNSPDVKSGKVSEQEIYVHLTQMVDQLKHFSQSNNAQQLKVTAAGKIATGIANGDQPPILTGLYGLSGPVRADLEDKNFDLTNAQLQFKTAEKQISTLNGPQMTRFVGLGRSVVNTIDETKRLAQQMQLSGIPLANRAALATYIQTQGNTPTGQLAARYLAAVNTIKEEFANLAQGGYAPTDAVWQLANGQINADYGVKELGASLDEVQRLIKYRLQAIPGLMEHGPGSPNRYMPDDESGAAGWGGTNNPGSIKQGASGAPPQINSQDEYQQLPSGSEYTAPDGSVRTKQ
jgi:hypothetical protein